MQSRNVGLFIIMCAVTVLASAPAYGSFINGSQLSISGDATVGFTFLNWSCNQPGDAVCAAPPANTGDFAVGGSTGSFAQYNSTFGKITNLTLAAEPLNQTFSDPGWITFDIVGNPNVSLELTFIPLGTDTTSATCAGLTHCTPTNAGLITGANPGGLSAFNLDQNAGGTAASFGVIGIAHDLLGSPSFSFGGIFTAQFAGLSPQQVLALVGPNGANATYSANISITAIPEPMTFSLVGAGLLGVGFWGRRLRRR